MKIKSITYVGLFAAIMGALSLVPPIFLSFTPVPVTVQTLGVLLAGGLLGARLGAMSQLVFLLLVAAGMPLLSGGRGGLSVFTGPSAGYILSWPITAYCVGLLIPLFRKEKIINILLINLTVGIFLIYLIGIPVQAFMMDISIYKAVQINYFYIPGDILKAILASILIYRLRKHPVFSRLLKNNSNPGKQKKAS